MLHPLNAIKAGWAAFRGRGLPMVQARYDAAERNEQNRKQWARVDNFNADRANDPMVRSNLRTLSRHECLEANSYGKGIVHTLGLDLIGRGPMLQVTNQRKAFGKSFETSFFWWMRRTKLVRKLQTMRVAKCVDGEAFGEMVTNRRLKHPVQLDFRITECDQFCTPQGISDYTRAVDGIEFDEFGNPEFYHRLPQHPGGYSYSLVPEPISADEVIHLFRQDRPGQHRGIPEVTPALKLFGLLRRYTLATVAAAETASRFSGVLQTNNSAVAFNGTNFDSQVNRFESVDIDYDMLVSLPYGWTLNQFKPEQPIESYSEFVQALLREISRCLHMPYLLAACDAHGHNYSSAKLDMESYILARDVERQYWEEECLDRLLEAFFEEYRYAVGGVPAAIKSFEDLNHRWIWTNRQSLDPIKEATAGDIRLKNGTSHRAADLMARGLDLDEEDKAAADGLGITVEEYRQAIFQALFDGSPVNVSAQAADQEAVAETRRTSSERRAARRARRRDQRSKQRAVV